jgi:hypothetical protein
MSKGLKIGYALIYFPGQSIPCVPREYLLELGAAFLARETLNSLDKF